MIHINLEFGSNKWLEFGIFGLIRIELCAGVLHDRIPSGKYQHSRLKYIEFVEK